MQNLKYYVLWVKNSPLLKEYTDKYYNKLISDLKELALLGVLKSEIEQLLKIENKVFILNSDNSSIINFLQIEFILKKSKYLWKKQEYVDLFKNEIILFLEWKYDLLVMNKWEKIPWTNIKLTTIDNNPYKYQEDHPDHHLNWWVIWYWEKTEQEWLWVYKKTFELLKTLDEWIYDELNEIIDKIVPLWTARWVHNSASYKECIGHLYMWYTIDTKTPEINILEAIIHESSHNKLNLIMQFDKLLLNDLSEKYYSAIRPDSRHIHWVLLWYHAFAPTMYILLKSYKLWVFWNDKGWLEKIVLYYIKTKFLQKIIKKYAVFTDLWKKIENEIDFVVIKMDVLIKEINPWNEILENAKETQKYHFNQVNKLYSYLEY
jgi:hypothetical protein